MGHGPSWAGIGWTRESAGLKGEVESAKTEIEKRSKRCVHVCYLRMVYCAWSIVAVVVAVFVCWLMKKLVVGVCLVVELTMECGEASAERDGG